MYGTDISVVVLDQVEELSLYQENNPYLNDLPLLTPYYKIQLKDELAFLIARKSLEKINSQECNIISVPAPDTIIQFDPHPGALYLFIIAEFVLSLYGLFVLNRHHLKEGTLSALDSLFGQACLWDIFGFIFYMVATGNFEDLALKVQDYPVNEGFDCFKNTIYNQALSDYDLLREGILELSSRLKTTLWYMILRFIVVLGVSGILKEERQANIKNQNNYQELELR